MMELCIECKDNIRNNIKIQNNCKKCIDLYCNFCESEPSTDCCMECNRDFCEECVKKWFKEDKIIYNDDCTTCKYCFNECKFGP